MQRHHCWGATLCLSSASDGRELLIKAQTVEHVVQRDPTGKAQAWQVIGNFTSLLEPAVSWALLEHVHACTTADETAAPG